MAKLAFKTIGERMAEAPKPTQRTKAPSSVRAKAKVSVTSRKTTQGDTFTTMDGIYYGLSAWDMRTDLDGAARYRIAS